MRVACLVFTVFLCITGAAIAQEKKLLLDDFEGVISGGSDGTVDFGAGNGSSVEVAADISIMHSGKQSLKVIYNAVPDGYMYVAKGMGLDAKNACWLVKPQDIKWNEYNAVSFYMYGSGSKAKVAFDIKDNGNEIWRYILEDNFQGWKQIVCSFGQFAARNDWQPEAADKNTTIDFPIKSYQFEPLPESQGTLYFDDVELIMQ